MFLPGTSSGQKSHLFVVFCSCLYSVVTLQLIIILWCHQKGVQSDISHTVPLDIYIVTSRSGHSHVKGGTYDHSLNQKNTPITDFSWGKKDPFY